ncbi:pecanex-like protein 3 [Patella vulgata]|uniref:pecanex-like protein 3 n=1 Tax=Patella vulgata TaxID=6465 RepID=UPI0024A81C5A|nr:pecanex-like protein 3 [Patella vulgata]
MGSHILDILRQGIWASLTGGWFYDPHQGIFCNTFHLYLWMFLLAFPLIIYLTLEPTVGIWAIYCGVLAVLFSVLKFINFHLHHMYDTGEVIEDDVKSETPASKGGSTENTNKTIEICNENEVPENIEMVSISRARETTPAETESKLEIISETETHNTSESKPLKVKQWDTGIAPLAVIEDDLTGESPGGKNSTGSTTSSVDESNPNSSKNLRSEVPHPITTQVEVEINPQIPKDTQNETKRLREESDSDLSPDYLPKLRLRRERRAVRRSKSALEPCTVAHIPIDNKPASRMSLPPLNRVAVSVVQKSPVDNQNISPKSKNKKEKVVKRFEHDGVIRLRNRTQSSKSVDAIKPRTGKGKQDGWTDQSSRTTSASNSPHVSRPGSLILSVDGNKFISHSSSHSSISDSSELSVGEVMFRSQKSRSRPGSGGTTSSGQTLTENMVAGKKVRNKEIMGLFKVSRYLQDERKRESGVPGGSTGGGSDNDITEPGSNTGI